METLLKKYPDHVPVILKRNGKNTDVPEISSGKFLVPKTTEMRELQGILRKKINIDSKKAIFIFVGDGILVPLNKTMNEMYELYKSDDHVLYVTYNSENTFG